MKEAKQYFDVFAWFGRTKTKIGFAYYQPKLDCLRVKAESHLNPSKVGRALMKGDILIQKQNHKPRESLPKPDSATPEDYQSFADEYELSMMEDEE